MKNNLNKKVNIPNILDEKRKDPEFNKVFNNILKKKRNLSNISFEEFNILDNNGLDLQTIRNDNKLTIKVLEKITDNLLFSETIELY